MGASAVVCRRSIGAIFMGRGGSVNGRKDAAAALFARWCFAVKNKRKRGLSGQAVSKAARKRG